jgi:hypothetical protein
MYALIYANYSIFPTHRSENFAFYAKAGKWIRRCIDPTRDLSLSFWNGLNIDSKAAADKEGRQYLLDDKLSQM